MGQFPDKKESSNATQVEVYIQSLVNPYINVDVNEKRRKKGRDLKYSEKVKLSLN